MAIIKSKSASSLLKVSSVIDLGDLSRQSTRILKEAQSNARQILKEAKDKADKLVEDASEKGYSDGQEQGMLAGREEGFDTGRAEALAQMAPQLEELGKAINNAIENWENERNQLFLEAREDVLEFAIAMAKKITHRIVQADPTIVKDQVIEALALLAEPTSAVISVAPQDRQTIESMIPDIMQKITNCTHIELHDDPEITQGGCLVTTKQGSINATIERQIERITETLCPYDIDKESEEVVEEKTEVLDEPDVVVEKPDDVVDQDSDEEVMGE